MCRQSGRWDLLGSSGVLLGRRGERGALWGLCPRLSKPHVAPGPLVLSAGPDWAKALCLDVQGNGESVFVNHYLNIH